MKTYKVLFYHGTDCRASCHVEAGSDLIALALALDQCGQADWSFDTNCRIEISVQKS